MSLVDDLLIETERRRGSGRAACDVRLEDLVPIRKSTSPRAARRLPIVLRTLLAAAALAALAVIAPRIPRFPSAAWQSPSVSSQAAAAGREAPTPIARTSATPPVAARPAQAESPEIPAADATPPLPATPRSVRVESLSLESLAVGARLRIVAESETPHRIEHASDASRFEIVLSGASLSAPDLPLDLRDTPIRSLDLHADGPDLRLALELDPLVRVQSRWLPLPVGAALVVELQAPAAAAIDAFAQPDTSAPDAFEAAALPFSVDPAFERSERDRRLAPADRIVSPPLGDPAELRIERSARDLAREERRAMHARVEALLADARSASAAGRIDDADGLYGEVAQLSPGDPRALVEWSELLAGNGRTEKALALLETARERAPRDPRLLIAHARLLGREGEHRRALGILDASGLSVTESPDVHALAAAYHQRAGDHEAAIERYERLLRRFPEESRGWMGLGISLEAVGRRDEARDVYRIALQVGELPTVSRSWLTTRLAALGQEG